MQYHMLNVQIVTEFAFLNNCALVFFKVFFMETISCMKYLIKHLYVSCVQTRISRIGDNIKNYEFFVRQIMSVSKFAKNYCYA